MKATIYKSAMLKKEGKRVMFGVYKNEEGDMIFILKTKRLIDKKTRNIQTTEVMYGMETMMVFHDCLTILFNDAEFKRDANREIGQVMKDNVNCKIETSIGL